MHALFLLAGLAFARPVVVSLGDPPLVRALHLPIAARAVRHAGVPPAQVLVTLDAVREHRIRAWDLVLVFDQSVVSMREYGPMPDYGVFVVSRLDRRLHGRDLADAIHREHRSHGHGKFKNKDKDHGYEFKYADKHDNGWHGRGNSGNGNSGNGNSIKGNSGKGNSGSGNSGGKHRSHGDDKHSGKGNGKGNK